jgi:hypothetical protein
MQLINVSFDSGLGDAVVDLASGTLQITLSDKNPEFPSGAQISIPLDPLFVKLQAQAPSLLVKWGEEAAQDLVDDVT